MKRLILISLTLLFLYSCEKQEIGYLDTTNAVYVPDSVVFHTLNPEDPEDARTIKFEIPFQSQGIQGVQGTLPISYSIARIESDKESAAFLNQFKLSGKAQIELPFNHTVPAGRYIFSIRVNNEGRTADLDSAITVIIN